jgi:DNA-binding response OmpR family regulator
MPEITGIELCQKVRVINEYKPVLFYSGMARKQDKCDAIEAGTTEYLMKPNDLDKLTPTIENLLKPVPCRRPQKAPRR